MTVMKNSDIGWIKNIPSSWKYDTIRHLMVSRDAGAWGVEPYEDEGTVCLRVADFDFSRGRIRSCGVEDLTKRRYTAAQIRRLALKKGDILIEKSGGGEKTPVGRAVLYDGEYGPVLYANFTERLRFDTSKVMPKYVEYWLRAWYFSRGAMYYINQTTGIQNINLSLMLAKEKIYYPPLELQESIINYLDSKCAEIDSLSADIQMQIDTLELYRKSVITEAVTKGINQDASVIECSIVGVTRIPAHWKVTRFKYVASIKSNLVAPSQYETYPQISPENIEKDSGHLLDYGTVFDAGVISWNHLFYKGQILYSKIRPGLNKVIIAPFDGLCSADMYPIETKLNTKFALYMMLSNYFVDQVSLVIQDRVKMPKINQEELGEIRVVIPPDMDQQGIVEYLDRKCTEIKAVIDLKKQQLMTLDDYKRSLIYEYVTGKKEVPNE